MMRSQISRLTYGSLEMTGGSDWPSVEMTTYAIAMGIGAFCLVRYVMSSTAWS